MQITRITKNNIYAFEDMFPEDFVFSEELLAFGTVSDVKEAASAMIIKAYDESLVIIDWIYTDPRYREMGAATELLDTVTAFLGQMGMKSIMISFRDDDEELEDFLSNRGFAVTAYDDIFKVPIGNLIYSKKLERMLEMAGKNLLTYDLNHTERYVLAIKLIREQGIDEEVLSGLSRKLSVLSMDKNGEAAGCILLKEMENGDLEVVYFLNDSKKAGVENLILGLQRNLEKNDVLDRKLVFADPKGSSIRLVEGLMDEPTEVYRVKGLLQGVKVL